jgi:hypothetical protein
MKISREQFIALMDAIRQVRQQDNDFSNVLSSYMNQEINVSSHDWFIDRLISILEVGCGCCGKIEYFVKDQDFGRVVRTGVKHYANAGELYDDLNRK